MTGTTIRKLVCLFFLTAGIPAAGNGFADRIVRWAGMGAVTAANQRYLDESFERATTGFVVLSGIKSGLAVVEGSRIGIGFSLELGDIVQALYDYVDIAWKTVLAGGTVLLLTRLMLEAGAAIDQYCLTAMLICFLLHGVVKWRFPAVVSVLRFLREVGAFLGVITIGLYIVLPLSLQGAARVSHKISQPLIREAQENFMQIRDEVSAGAIQEKLFPDREPGKSNWYSSLQLSDNFERIKQNIKTLQEYLAERTRQAAVWTIKLIAGYLFDCIVFPLVFAMVLFLFVKGMTRYVFYTIYRAGIKEDMASVLTTCCSPSDGFVKER